MEYIVDFGSFVSLIKEGLIKTYDIDKTIFNIKNTLSINNINFNVGKNPNNTFYIELLDFNKIIELETVLELVFTNIIDLYGWFPSIMELENIYGMKNTKRFNKKELKWVSKNILSAKITFESKFDLLEDNIPKNMYHLSIKQYKNDILKNGIFPKSKSKLSSHEYDDSGRIYLSDSLLSCKSLIPQMKLFYSGEKNNILFDPKNIKRHYNKNTDWILFEIDTKDVDKLYKDPNSTGYYFLGNIKPDNIKVIEEE
jgi:hypothetical protein